MNPHQLKRIFPNASAATLAANAGDYGAAVCAKNAPTETQPIRIIISGQVRGGKNGMGVTRTGRHYAKPTFAAWRDEACRQVRTQLPVRWTPIAEPVTVELDYVAGDKRRRDMPAVLDAVWHVLERAKVVEDDTLLWVVRSSRSYDKANPHVTITITP